MAKKKRKLNTRVVIVLSLAGALVLGLFVLFAGDKILGKLFPKNPEDLLRKAEAAQADGRFDEAQVNYMAAVAEAGKANMLQPKYLVKLAQFHLDRIKAPISMSERRDRYQAAKDCLKQALRIKKDDLEAQRLLTNLIWDVERQAWADYIVRADELLALDPADHLTWFRRALANSELARDLGGDYSKKALADYLKAIELKGDETQYWMGLATFQKQRLNNDAEAEATLLRGIEQNKANPRQSADLRVFYAQLLLMNKKELEAKSQLDEAIKSDPRNMTARLALAGYYERSHPEDAVKSLEEAIGIDPLDDRPYLVLANIRTRRGQINEALTVIRRGLNVLSGTETAPATSTSPASETEDRSQLRLEMSRARLSQSLANLLLEQCEEGGLSEADYKAKLTEARAQLDAINILGSMAVARLQGRLLYNEGKLDEARKYLEQVVQANNDDNVPAILLMQLYVRQGLPGNAQRMLDRFLQMPNAESNTQLQVIKARIQALSRDYDGAIKTLDRVLEKEARNTQALELRRVFDAIRSGQATEVSEGYVGLMLRQAVNWNAEGRFDDAVETLNKLYTQYPKNREVGLTYANVLASARTNKEENEKRALSILASLKTQYPDDQDIDFQMNLLHQSDPDKRRQMEEERADQITNPLDRALTKVRIAAMYNREDDVRKWLNEAATIDPRNITVLDQQFRMALKDRGKEDWNTINQVVARAGEADRAMGRKFAARVDVYKKDFPAAVAELLEVVKDNPEDKFAQVTLGDCYLELGELTKAQEAYQAIASVDPGFGPAAVGMARVTERQANWPDHEMWVNVGHRLVPNNTYIKQEYLRLQDERLDPKQAIVQREQIRNDNPDDVLNLVRLGSLYERANQMDDAEKTYKAVFAKLNDKLQGAQILLDFYLRTNRDTDLERILNEITSDPGANAAYADRVRAFVLYGDTCMRKGTREWMSRAKAAYERAVDVSPPDEVRGYQALSNYYTVQGDLPKAIESARKVSERLPANRYAERRLIGLLIRNGQLDDAEKRLIALRQAEPNNASVLAMLAELNVNRDQPDEALKLLDQAVANNPNLPEILLSRADLRISLGDVSGAKADLEAARRLNPSPETLRQTAVMSRQIRDDNGAEQAYLEILRRNENNKPAIMGLVDLYLDQHKWDSVDARLKRAVEMFPNDPQFPLAMAERWKRTGDTPENRAERCKALKQAFTLDATRLGLYPYLIGLLETGQPDQAMEVSKDYVGRQKYGAWLLALRGRALVNLKRTDEADQVFQQAIKDAGEDEMPIVMEQLIIAYPGEQAATRLSRWVELAPKSVYATLKLGDLYSDSKKDTDIRQALVQYDKAVAMTDNKILQAEIQIYRAGAYHLLKDYAKAEQCYLETLKTLPLNGQCLNNLAYMLTEQGRPADALKYAVKASRLLPQNPDTLDTLAWTLTKLERFDEALPILQRALDTQSPPAIVRYHMGYVLEKTGRSNDALTQYRQALAMLPKDDSLYATVQEALDRLLKR